MAMAITTIMGTTIIITATTMVIIIMATTTITITAGACAMGISIGTMVMRTAMGIGTGVATKGLRLRRGCVHLKQRLQQDSGKTSGTGLPMTKRRV